MSATKRRVIVSCDFERMPVRHAMHRAASTDWPGCAASSSHPLERQGLREGSVNAVT